MKTISSIIKLYLLPLYLASSQVLANSFFNESTENKIKNFGNNAYNFVHNTVSFDHRPILERAEIARQAIIRRQQESENIISTRDELSSKTRLIEEANRGRKCDGGAQDLNLKINTAIAENCKVTEVKELCQTNQHEVAQLLNDAELNLSPKQLTGNNIISRLHIFKERLLELSNTAYFLNESCKNAFSNKILRNSQCLSSYDQVFNNEMAFIERNCSLESLDNAMTDYVTFMRDPDLGIGAAITAVKASYGTSRQTEAGLAELLVKVDNSISDWEEANGRQPSTLNSSTTANEYRE